ncbi:DC-STAMP domain-containing protein [Acrasis kona]|uniref:DC-STAMP domain-containing protein n=1 Tax=Acrasis kona TaxID=1008807 RepID=A0AAW2ZT01_9EUKA
MTKYLNSILVFIILFVFVLSDDCRQCRNLLKQIKDNINAGASDMQIKARLDLWCRGKVPLGCDFSEGYESVTSSLKRPVTPLQVCRYMNLCRLTEF